MEIDNRDNHSQRIDELSNKIEELEEGTEDVQEKSFLKKFRNFAVTLMLLMISIGQWNDTKDVILSAYEEIVSRWTNALEYEKLSQLRVGYSSEYVENLLGLPQVTKHSKHSENTTFSYYSTSKYILTTAVTNKRLSGFSVIALKNDFYAPIVYLDKALNTNRLDSYIPSQGLFMTDFGNVEYFIENYELSRNFMFYDFSLGVINYGLLTDELRSEIKALNLQLNTGEELLLSDLSVQNAILPNYYSVSEFPSEIMRESILSRYEMLALFKHE